MAYIGKITDTSSVTGLIGSTLFGTCATAVDTVAKVGTLADFDALIHGVTVHLKMTYSNTASNPTLNVNSTGAKAIYRYGTTAPGITATESWAAGEVVSFTYIEDTPGTASTGHWYMNDKEPIKQASYGTASAGTAFTVPNVTGSTSVTIPNVTGNTSVTIPNVTGVTAGEAASLSKTDYTLTYSAVSIPNVTGNSNVSIPNVTGNTEVDCLVSATISSGVLTFTQAAAGSKPTKTTLGTALSASKVTLGTALSASSISAPASGTKWSHITAWTTNTPTVVTLGTALTASKVTLGTALTASKVTLGTAFTIPNISVSSKTVVVPV